jgi:hypothetical protein
MTYHKENYPRGEDWHKIHKYPGMCYRCDKQGQKKDFIPLYVRMSSYDSHRILARLCPECLNALADELDVTLPEGL